MKYIFTLLIMTQCLVYADNVASKCSLLYSHTVTLNEQLIVDEYERKLALYEFLYEYAGSEYVKKNKRYIDRLLTKNIITTDLDKILKSSISDKKTRKDVIRKFSYPRASADMSSFRAQLNELLPELRCLQSNGKYKYAYYIKQPGSFVEKQKLTAKHEIGSFQKYEKTFNEKIYRVHMFSPTKIGMFGGNRDVYLGTLSLKYWSSGQQKNIVQKYNRFLKRGESIDFELPDIADQVNIVLTFACKPEHKNKAVFYVEPIAAALVDRTDSPYSELVSKIKEFRNTKEYVTEIQTLLKDHMLSKNVSVVTQSPSNNEDQLNYFYYLISDQDISRDILKQKFRKMFLNK